MYIEKWLITEIKTSDNNLYNYKLKNIFKKLSKSYYIYFIINQNIIINNESNMIVITYYQDFIYLYFTLRSIHLEWNRIIKVI